RAAQERRGGNRAGDAASGPPMPPVPSTPVAAKSWGAHRHPRPFSIAAQRTRASDAASKLELCWRDRLRRTRGAAGSREIPGGRQVMEQRKNRPISARTDRAAGREIFDSNTAPGRLNIAPRGTAATRSFVLGRPVAPDGTGPISEA